MTDKEIKITDEEIIKTIKGILRRNNTAEIKRNKNGIVVLEVAKKIVKSDKEQ